MDEELNEHPWREWIVGRFTIQLHSKNPWAFGFIIGQSPFVDGAGTVGLNFMTWYLMVELRLTGKIDPIGER
jgi:hypothetical protein